VKYDYATEWLRLVRRLWSEDRVSHHGRWFDLDECVSGPTPLQPGGPKVLCAGSSPAGMRFTAAEATHGFVGGSDPAAIGRLARDYKRSAAENDRSLEVYSVTMLVLGRTVAEAEDRIAAYEAEPDVAAVLDHHGEYSKPTAGESLRRDAADLPPVWFGARPTARTPAMLADELHELHEGGIDGMLLSAADWAHDLDLVEHEVLPALRDRGVVAPLPGRPGVVPDDERAHLSAVTQGT
jgi:pyrimidine oxygenase